RRGRRPSRCGVAMRGGELLQLVHPPRRQDELGPLILELPRQAGADPGRSSRDEDPFSRKLHAEPIPRKHCDPPPNRVHEHRMRLTVLASGSGGNSILVEADRARVLVDAGLAPRDIARRIDRTVTGARLDDVQAVIVTHEHEDHASGAPALASAGLTLFCTAGTARAAKLARTREICAGETTGVGALEGLPVTLLHDAAEHVGLILRDEGGSAGIILDCGHADADAARAFAACDVLILQTNPYPDLPKA